MLRTDAQLAPELDLRHALAFGPGFEFFKQSVGSLRGHVRLSCYTVGVL
jgi:hypothetical protein